MATQAIFRSVGGLSLRPVAGSPEAPSLFLRFASSFHSVQVFRELGTGGYGASSRLPASARTPRPKDYHCASLYSISASAYQNPALLRRFSSSSHRGSQNSRLIALMASEPAIRIFDRWSIIDLLRHDKVNCHSGGTLANCIKSDLLAKT